MKGEKVTLTTLPVHLTPGKVEQPYTVILLNVVMGSNLFLLNGRKWWLLKSYAAQLINWQQNGLNQGRLSQPQEMKHPQLALIERLPNLDHS